MSQKVQNLTLCLGHFIDIKKTDSQEIKVDNTRKRKSSEILPEIEQENQKLKEAQTCKICLVKEIRVVFIPCGHLMSCVNCARKLKKCAVCR